MSGLEAAGPSAGGRRADAAATRFVTAYDQYALQALRSRAAVDYVLKPVQPDRRRRRWLGVTAAAPGWLHPSGSVRAALAQLRALLGAPGLERLCAPDAGRR